MAGGEILNPETSQSSNWIIISDDRDPLLHDAMGMELQYNSALNAFEGLATVVGKN